MFRKARMAVLESSTIKHMILVNEDLFDESVLDLENVCLSNPLYLVQNHSRSIFLLYLATYYFLI